MTRENQEILRRILAREPEYNHLEWDRQWEENEQFMDNIARYPRDWWEIEQEEKQRRKEELREVCFQIRVRVRIRISVGVRIRNSVGVRIKD